MVRRKEKVRLEEPPEGFRWFRSGRTFGWVREGLEFSFESPPHRPHSEEASTAAPMLDSEAPRAADMALRGRGELLKIALDRAGREHALVRHYCRGGLAGRLLRDRYWGAARFFEEARITERARVLGVPAPVVLAVRAEKLGCGWYRGDLATREISGTRDLAFYLRTWRETGAVPGERLRTALVRRLGETVRRMHDAGIFHSDLNVKNLLVKIGPGGGEEIQAFVVDLDKAKILPSVPARLRAENILRLYRSLEKQGFAGSVVGTRDRMGFLRAYGLGSRHMVRELAHELRRGTRSLRFHRVAWRLCRLSRSLWTPAT